MGLVKHIAEETYSLDEISSDLIISEGSKQTITVNKYERDPKARIACIEHRGSVCAVCGFDFGAVYGYRFPAESIFIILSQFVLSAKNTSLILRETLFLFAQTVITLPI